MAYEIPGPGFTLPAAADFSTKQYHALVANNAGRAAIAGAGVPIIGILQNAPAAIDRACTIVDRGISKGVAGAAVTRGANVMVNGSGRFITATATNYAVGTALESAGADGDVIAIHLGGSGVVPS
jgi:hypothetical protein